MSVTLRMPNEIVSVSTAAGERQPLRRAGEPRRSAPRPRCRPASIIATLGSQTATHPLRARHQRCDVAGAAGQVDDDLARARRRHRANARFQRRCVPMLMRSFMRS